MSVKIVIITYIIIQRKLCGVKDLPFEFVAVEAMLLKMVLFLCFIDLVLLILAFCSYLS